MPALRTRDTLSRPLEVSTDAPQPPTLAIISPTPRTFTFPQSHNLSDSPYSTPSSSPFEPDLRSLALSSSTPPLTRTLSPDSISSASPAPSSVSSPQHRRRKSSTGPSSGSSPDAERRPKKGDEGYIKRPENAFILFRRKCCEDRLQDLESSPSQISESSPSAPTKKQRQADLSKTISQQWKSLPAEERQFWERMAKEKKKEHEMMYPNYVYRPQRVRDKDGKVRNKKRQPRGEKGQVQITTSVPQHASPASTSSIMSPMTDSESFSFVIPPPRQHGRSASAPTPPPMSYQSISIPTMHHIMAPSPSCPTSPSLLPVVSPTNAEMPMISRRATLGVPGVEEGVYSGYEHLIPPQFAQGGFGNVQASDHLRSMFDISPSSTTVSSSNPSNAQPITLPTHIQTNTLLPSPEIISPGTDSGCSSAGPISPSHFLSQPEFNPHIHSTHSSFSSEYDPSQGYLPEYAQYEHVDYAKYQSYQDFPVDYSDYAEVPDFQAPEGYRFTWDTENAFPSSFGGAEGAHALMGGDEFDLSSIPPCEVGGVASVHATPTQEKTIEAPQPLVARPLEGVEGGLEVEFEYDPSMEMEPMQMDMESNAIMSMGNMMGGMGFDEMMAGQSF